MLLDEHNAYGSGPPKRSRWYKQLTHSLQNSASVGILLAAAHLKGPAYFIF